VPNFYFQLLNRSSTQRRVLRTNLLVAQLVVKPVNKAEIAGAGADSVPEITTANNSRLSVQLVDVKPQFPLSLLPANLCIAGIAFNSAEVKHSIYYEIINKTGLEDNILKPGSLFAGNIISKMT